MVRMSKIHGAGRFRDSTVYMLSKLFVSNIPLIVAISPFRFELRFCYRSFAWRPVVSAGLILLQYSMTNSSVKMIYYPSSAGSSSDR